MESSKVAASAASKDQSAILRHYGEDLGTSGESSQHSKSLEGAAGDMNRPSDENANNSVPAAPRGNNTDHDHKRPRSPLSVESTMTEKHLKTNQENEADVQASPERVTLSQEQRNLMLEDARVFGFWPWLEKYSALHLADLFQVFDVVLPNELDRAPIEDLLPLLYALVSEKAPQRKKRVEINTVDDVVQLLEKSKNIMILTGAGCSVSCGIPDFRSKNGIYSRLEEFDLEDPQQMFDIDYFRYSPQTFYSFAKEIYPSNFKPSPSHMFIKLLQEKGKLLRNYTQNIDTLEKAAGITRVVQCHGSFATASCIVCGYSVPGTAIEEDIFAKKVPRCPKCHEDHDGLIKPDIVFFGEKLPDEFDRYFREDREKVDLLIVMGSSLKVSPVAEVKDRIPHEVPQILINLECLPHMDNFDIQLLGYCDTIVAELCRRLGWQLEHPSIQSNQEFPGARQSTILFHRFLFEGAVELSDQPGETSDDQDSDLSSEGTSDSSRSDEHDLDGPDREIRLTDDWAGGSSDDESYKSDAGEHIAAETHTDGNESPLDRIVVIDRPDVEEPSFEEKG